MSTLLYLYHGPTLFKGGNNPFGHTAIALPYSGLYSFGNSANLGSMVTTYLADQLKGREVWAVLLPITGTQAVAIMNYLHKFPKNRPNQGIDLITTCATRTGDAMREADLGREEMVHNPETYGFPLSQYKMVREFKGARVIHLPQRSKVPWLCREFDPSGKK